MTFYATRLTHNLNPWENEEISKNDMYNEFNSDITVVNKTKTSYTFKIPYSKFNQTILDDIYNHFKSNLIITTENM